MNIAIIEYKENIVEALKYFQPENTLFLSVSGEASYCLSKRNIDFITDEERLNPEEFKAIGDENCKILENWIQRLEERLQSKNSLFKKKHFFPFKWHFYRLKILLDAVRIRKILIERLIEKEKPLSIGAPPGAVPQRIHDHNLFFHKYDSLYGILTQKIAAEKGIEIKVWAKVEPATKKPPVVEGIKASLRTLRKALRVVLESNDLLKHKRIRGNILLGNLCYDIAPLRQKLLDKFNFYYYKDPLCIRSLSSLLKLKPKTSGCEFPEIDIKGIFKGLPATGDSIVDEILGDRIESYAESFIPVLWKGLNYLESLDDRKDFKAYIHHVGASDAFYGLPVYYFERKKKPVVIVQHGTYGFVLNQNNNFCEFGHNGYFLAWGEGVKEVYDERKKGSCKIISTGSPLIEEIKKKSKPRRTISKICYIPGTYRGYTAYYPNGQPCLDSKIFIVETNFLSALRPYVGRYDIIYKVAPWAVKESGVFGRNPMLMWMRENLPTVRIESRPLTSVIHEFDFFIIDFPSTTLIQALASGAEVLVYAGNRCYTLEDNTLEMLRKRAVVACNEDDFKDKIKLILDKGIVTSNVKDASFLEKYGIHLNNGESLKRMADEVNASVSNLRMNA
ncbi:MAG: hypothetical protein JSV30_07230 [Candidatus Omnitrophota bacterium]|nr:MAG: hypothetical protein JSV30_07230 [Candidatus Omnitrophota bacterium]